MINIAHSIRINGHTLFGSELNFFPGFASHHRTYLGLMKADDTIGYASLVFSIQLSLLLIKVLDNIVVTELLFTRGKSPLYDCFQCLMQYGLCLLIH